MYPTLSSGTVITGISILLAVISYFIPNFSHTAQTALTYVAGLISTGFVHAKVSTSSTTSNTLPRNPRS